MFYDEVTREYSIKFDGRLSILPGWEFHAKETCKSWKPCIGLLSTASLAWAQSLVTEVMFSGWHIENGLAAAIEKGLLPNVLRAESFGSPSVVRGDVTEAHFDEAAFDDIVTF